MIALCRLHHIQADNGAFTTEQLRTFKREGRNSWAQVSGKFNWLRHRLLTVVGGNFFYETPVVFQFKGQRVIWFDRDESGYLLLNLNMLTNSGEPRASISNNEWFNTGFEEDIESGPSAKRLRIRYRNGDAVTVEYFELLSVDDAKKRYQQAAFDRWEIEFPVTAVEVTSVVGGSGLQFNARETKIGNSLMRNCFFSHCGAGLVID
jgi:hypothetical protein